ncbi:MAG TPA: ribosome maturation factor RimP [Polyangiaceae bacterium]|nr:ribosome maturation factor RimP [Polyangiaceae bacterium]
MLALTYMRIAHEKLDGLSRDRVVEAVAPVLDAHGVDCVELAWKTDRGSRVLEVTIERPGARDVGAGVTLELCTEISRDLSAALDVADCIGQSYRLEVGSPGVERALYGAEDFARFNGQAARLKLRVPQRGQYVVIGQLHGLDEAGRIVFEDERGELVNIELAEIESARLVFQWKKPSAVGRGKKKQRHSGSK